MRIQHITTLSQTQAEQQTPGAGEAIISITDPGAPLATLMPGWKKTLRIQFGDVVYDKRTIDFYGNSWPAVEGVFREIHAESIHRFITEVESDPQINHITVHCHAGQSRSTAVATWIARRNGLGCPLSWSGRNATVLEVLEDPARYEWAWKNTRPGLWGKLVRTIFPL
jgi:predicted protein tyrosine phosphatase